MINNNMTPPNNSGQSMVQRQLAIEEETKLQALRDHTKVLNELMDMGRGTGLKVVQRMFLKWYEPFVLEIKEEINLIKTKKSDHYGRSVYGPLLMLLPPEKLAIITINTVLNAILRSHNAGGYVQSIVVDIADTIQTEFYSMMRLSRPFTTATATTEDGNKLAGAAITDSSGTAAAPGPGTVPGRRVYKERNWREEMVKQLLEGGNVTKGILMRIKRLMDESEEWPVELKIKVGSALVALLLQTAKFDSKDIRLEAGVGSEQPAMLHTTTFTSDRKKRIGLIKLDPARYESLLARATGDELSPMMIKYLPMIVPPLPWRNQDQNAVPYYLVKAPLVRTFYKQQIHAVRQSTMPGLIDSLNYLNSIPWKINSNVYHVIQEAWKQNITIGVCSTVVLR